MLDVARRPSKRGPLGSGGAGWVLSLPALLAVAGLLILPIGQAVYYSMTNWNGQTATWIGPRAYLNLFEDPTFLRVIENNGLLLLAMPFAIIVPLWRLRFSCTRRSGVGSSSDPSSSSRRPSRG